MIYQFNNIRKGFKLFLLTELMFFISFLFALYYVVYVRSKFILVKDENMVLNTITSNYPLPFIIVVILIISLLTINRAYINLKKENLSKSYKAMVITIILGLITAYLLRLEFKTTCFSISDGFFPSIFFMLLFVHYFHFVGGIIFLFIVFIRLKKCYLTSYCNTSFALSLIY